MAKKARNVTKQVEENTESVSEELKSYLAKTKTELREICRQKGIRNFSGLKHDDLAKAALEGKSQPQAGSGMHNDQLRLRLKELGLPSATGNRSDLVAKVSEAEEFITRVKAAMEVLKPGSSAEVNPETFKGDAKNLLNLILVTIEAKSKQ